MSTRQKRMIQHWLDRPFRYKTRRICGSGYLWRRDERFERGCFQTLLKNKDVLFWRFSQDFVSCGFGRTLFPLRNVVTSWMFELSTHSEYRYIIYNLHDLYDDQNNRGGNFFILYSKFSLSIFLREYMIDTIHNLWNWKT